MTKVRSTGLKPARASRGAGLGLLLFLAGCSDQDVTTYRVPKDPGTPATVAESGPAGGTAALHWATPAGWQPQAASGLRAASFLAPGPDGATADVSVVKFAGAGGDVLANINRWRGQLQLPPIAAGALPGEVTALDAPGGHFLLADIRGSANPGHPALRLLGAWLEQPDQVWFFKMMGPAAVVEAQRDRFLDFLRSMTPGAVDQAPAPAAPAGTRAAENTNDLPHAGFVVAPTSAPDAPALVWQAPAQWQSLPVTAMRKGSYAVGRGATAADLSITAFPGEVGGLAANLNRWRGQIGLPPLDGAALAAGTETLEANGLHFTLVDFAGPAAGSQQRILAALTSWQGATWFFKLMGPAGPVEDEKAAFTAFLGTVRSR